ncbi:MAG: IS481 family transposase, partial [Proteobacteria bacterium]|nr:IS481 family transposase [Pseudomonadota bacterium]
MVLHPSARTCPRSRGLLVRRVVEEKWRIADVAAVAGVSARTVYKWLRRYREEGPAGLFDRSSRPMNSPRRLAQEVRDSVVQLRREGLTGRAVSVRTGASRSTVSRLPRAARLSRARDLKPPQPANRYERATPGEILHVDITKLARFWRPGHRVTNSREKQSIGAGWEFVHVCVDDHSRLAYVEILPDEKAASAVPFMRRAVGWFREQGIHTERVMTDNGSCYRSRRFAGFMKETGIKHPRTRPYTPRTNGKAERFIKTLLGEWAYVQPYSSSEERRQHLPPYVAFYNDERPHHSLGALPPRSRQPSQVS